jgi:hypothetical protein
MSRKTDPTSLLTLSPQTAPRQSSLPTARQTLREASPKQAVAPAAGVAPSVDMNPAEPHGQRAPADKRAYGEINLHLAVAPTARVVAAMAGSVGAVETGVAAGIAVAGEEVEKPRLKVVPRRERTPGERLMSNYIGYFRRKISLTPFSISALLFACLFVTPFASAEETAASQRVFASPEAASSALVSASKADDMNALSSLLGQDANQILSSGDSVADNNARDDFVRRYQEMHRLAYDDQGRVILYIGADNWPVPIPLVKKNGGWVFDTAAGTEELLYRRIGRNELFTINASKISLTPRRSMPAKPGRAAARDNLLRKS